MREQGVCKFFNPEKGFGFLSRPNAVDVFVHKSDLKTAGLEKLDEGQTVSFTTVPSRDGKGPKAINITIGLP